MKRKVFLKKGLAVGTAISVLASLVACSPKQNMPNSQPEATTDLSEDVPSPQADKRSPNVVYIVLDDMGFSDLGCYGSEISTPNIDRLAQDGLRYNNFCASPISSPTRASLLTGRSPHSVGISRITNYSLGVPHSTGQLDPSATTVAEILKDSGYNTMAVGKWHLAPGWEQTASGPYNNWPLAKGFERFYGYMDGETNQYTPGLIYDNHYVGAPYGDPTYHLTEDLADHAIDFLRAQQSNTPDKPFMLYFAPGATHRPHQVAKEYIERYKGVYDKGWDAIRAERYQKQKELGIIPKDTAPLSADPAVPAWDTLSQEEKNLFVQMQQVYAGFLEHADEQVGSIIDELEKMGQLDNTLIVLISDNGASPEGGNNGALNISKVFNGIPYTIEENLGRIDQIGTLTSSYPRGWAQVGNTPFSGYKGNASQLGGLRVPLIVRYPDGISSTQNGSVRDQHINVTDISTTVYDVLGIKYPQIYQGIEQMDLHGVSFANTFSDPMAKSNRTTQYFEMFGSRGLYHNDWFLSFIHEKGTDFADDELKLYHVAEDYSMQKDVAADNPDKIKELLAVWDEQAEIYGVNPLDDQSEGEILTKQTFKQIEQFDHATLYPGDLNISINSCYLYTALNRSYSISATVERETPDDEGVILSIGSAESGLSFYIKDNRLVYTYNYVGKIFETVSEVEVPVGKSDIKVEYKKDGEWSGTATLFIDGNSVGTLAIPQVYPFILSTFDGMSVGSDTLSPVSPTYADKGSFTFSGKLDKVEMDCKNDYNKDFMLGKAGK